MEDYYVRLIEPVVICWAGGKMIVVGTNWFVFGII